MKRAIILAVLLVLVLFASGCISGNSGGSPSGTGSVEGWIYQKTGVYTVTDSATAPTGYSPVSGASVTVQGTAVTGQTDGTGHFRLDGIPSGERIVAISTSDWAGRIPVTVRANTVARVPAGGEEKEWTVMLYGVTDYSLLSEIAYIRDDLESVGTNARINIVGMVGKYDTLHPEDPQHAQRFVIDHDNTVTITDTLDVDMGDKVTLDAFIDWAWANYPAKRKMLITYGHGNGWYVTSETRGMRPRPGARKPASSKTGMTRGILYDLIHDNNIDVDQLGDVLADKHFDFVVLNHCATLSIEVAHELVGIADYVVGSEAIAARYSFDKLIQGLNSNPSDGLSAVRAMGQDYVDWMVGWDYPATFSVIDTTKLPALATSLSEMATAILANSTTLRNISDTVATHNNTQLYSDYGNYTTGPNAGVYDYADIYDLADRIAGATAYVDATTRAKAAEVKTKLTDAVVYNYARNASGSPVEGGTYPVDRSKGLMIAWPSEPGFDSGFRKYNVLSFAQATAWDDLLTARGDEMMF